jgi:hypothetical protein
MNYAVKGSKHAWRVCHVQVGQVATTGVARSVREFEIGLVWGACSSPSLVETRAARSGPYRAE